MTTASYLWTSAMQLSFLLAQVPGELLVDIVDEAVERRRRRGLLGLDGGAHLGLDLVGEAAVAGLVEPALGEEERAQPGERVLGGLPLEGHALVAVARRVVRRGMGADAVGQRLDEGRAVAAPRLFHGASRGRVD